ncbi:MAG: type II secretion system protein [Eubacteriaceae bacterium]|nr:type II secretion system protein [Eubacteriaceae bacterium]
MNINNKHFIKKKAFTLIELVVVLAIISMLTAIALIKFNFILQDAKEKIDLSNVSYLNSTSRIYKIESGDWPDASTDLIPNYIKEIPTSPTGGSYIYDVSTNEFSYSAP